MTDLIVWKVRDGVREDVPHLKKERMLAALFSHHNPQEMDQSGRDKAKNMATIMLQV